MRGGSSPSQVQGMYICGALRFAECGQFFFVTCMLTFANQRLRNYGRYGCRLTRFLSSQNLNLHQFVSRTGELCAQWVESGSEILANDSPLKEYAAAMSPARSLKLKFLHLESFYFILFNSGTATSNTRDQEEPWRASQATETAYNKSLYFFCACAFIRAF